jgi:N-acetyl-anhydromuramyl-L-alanine amidase AmpD
MTICAHGMLAEVRGVKTDINSSSIGIELDNNGTEVFRSTNYQLNGTIEQIKERI